MSAINVTHNSETTAENRGFRAAIFGGTFNPVHLGHQSIACEIKERFSLDRVFVVPSSVPPHKSIQDIAEVFHRIAMLNLCFDAREGFEVSDVEMTRVGPSYSIDTAKEFLRRLPKGAELFLVMGMDAFLEIDTWRSYGRLLELLPLIVMTRPGACSPDESERLAADRYLKENISTRYSYCSELGCFTHPDYKEIHITDVTPVNISSTEIRNIVKQKRPLTDLVHNMVADYIHKKGLYL